MRSGCRGDWTRSSVPRPMSHRGESSGSSRSGTKQECSPLTFGPIGTGPPSAAGKVSGLRLVFLYRIGNVVKGRLGGRGVIHSGGPWKENLSGGDGGGS